MANRPPHVPQFGNWDANDQVPFTAVFDKARVGKGGGKIINPNDIEENPAAFGLKHEESFQPGVETGSNALPRRQSGDTFSRAGAADGSKRSHVAGGGRETVGTDESPNHQVYQGRLGNRPGSPYSERKNPSEGGNVIAPSAPGKSRLRPGSRADETPDRGAALPKFGAWDESDPSAGEGFTVIFNQARNEKKTGGPVRIPAGQTEAPANLNYGDSHKPVPNPQQRQKESSFWSCCWGSRASK